ncbi:MAG: leucine-rich repeat domain-containing protein [Oscillospiraceae bacterium]|nr:leucine-rich repeat domain-containing protein [Oscillospiraceae bacterium]
MQSFLIAYGYEYTPGAGGRPTNDVQAMLDALVEKYKTCPKPSAIGALIFENPEYKGQLKTFQNKCQELFGMSPKQYLQQLGIMAEGRTHRRRAPRPEAHPEAAPGPLEAILVPPEASAQSEHATDVWMFDYSISVRGQVSILRYLGQDEVVEVPAYIEGCPVTAIDMGAFQDNIYLTELILPDTVTRLYRGALQGCISVRKIRLSQGMTSLSAATFSGCIGLKEINIPDGIEKISKGTFRDAQLETLHIGKSVTHIDPQAFFSGEYDQFTGGRKSGRGLRELTVDPENPYFRAAGTSLLSADGKTLLLSLGELGHYVVPERVEVIGASVFKDLTELTGITLPNSLTVIESEAFAGSGLRAVRFGGGLRTIKDNAFFRCEQLTRVVFAEGLEKIGSRAFEGCPISLVELPASLRTLAPDSFDILCGHNTEQKLDISFGNPWLCTDGKALYTMENGEKTLSIVYDQDLKGDHWGTSGAAFTVEEGTTAIAPGVFQGVPGLKRVLLPEGLRTIGDSAFRDCMNLNSIQLPQSLTSIGDRAFEGTSIKNFSLPKGIEQIGTAAFQTGKGGFHIHEIWLSRENPAFHIENNVLCRRTESGLWVLGCFGGAAVVRLPEEVTKICPEAFYRSAVEEVHIPASVTEIGKNAFQGCMNLKRLCVEFPRPENGVSHAVIYLPGAGQEQDRQSVKLRGQYMDCIQISRQKTVFDFVKYDSLFPAITKPKPKDKILVATDRLKSAIQLAPLYRDAYLSYLQRNAEQAVRIVVEFDDLAGLTVLAELGVFTGENIDQVVELANASKKPEIVGYLMNYKNASIGFTETDYEL